LAPECRRYLPSRSRSSSAPSRAPSTARKTHPAGAEHTARRVILPSRRSPRRKTTLAQRAAKSFHCIFSAHPVHVGTSPSECLGVSVYSPIRVILNFVPAHFFANVVLAYEIKPHHPAQRNRASLSLIDSAGHRFPRRQNAPSSAAVSRVATQNPVDITGTFPCRSQLDRFLMRIKMGYPSHERNEFCQARWR